MLSSNQTTYVTANGNHTCEWIVSVCISHGGLDSFDYGVFVAKPTRKQIKDVIKLAKASHMFELDFINSGT